MKKKMHIFLGVCLVALLCGCVQMQTEQEPEKQEESAENNALDWESFKLVNSMELSYANQFSVTYYEDNYKLFHIEREGDFLLIPEDGKVPENLPTDITVINSPVENIYLVSTSVMDLFRVIDALDTVRFTGTKSENWYVEEARTAMEENRILYAGKYNAPDFELLLEGNCQLAIENAMIYHNPEIKEQLEKTGIPVMVELSSYETHPLGRMEWVKFYGALLNKEEEANAFFEEQTKHIQELEKEENTGKTVAFFYITSNGAVNIRKSNDYISKMIEMAGGQYAFSDLQPEEENALSTMKIQMEEFYATAKDADILIYNSTIDAELYTIDELLQKSEFFADFKAVQSGQVYCTGKDMFQQTAESGTLIEDFHKVLTGQDADFVFLHKLQ